MLRLYRQATGGKLSERSTICTPSCGYGRMFWMPVVATCQDFVLLKHLSPLALSAEHVGIILFPCLGTGWRSEDERRHRHAVDVLGGHQELLSGMNVCFCLFLRCISRCPARLYECSYRSCVWSLRSRRFVYTYNCVIACVLVTQAYTLCLCLCFFISIVWWPLGFRQDKEGFLQGQIGNPDGDDKPNKKFYDPRVWIRKASYL